MFVMHKNGAKIQIYVFRSNKPIQANQENKSKIAIFQSN